MGDVLRLWVCSFCKRVSQDVKYLVSAGQPGDAAICYDCIPACQDIVDLQIMQDNMFPIELEKK